MTNYELSDIEVIESYNHEQMIYRDHLWPHKFVLPIKRWKENELECGLIFNKDKKTIYKLNFFMLGYVNIEEAEKLKYLTVKEIVNDGWKVD